MDFFFLSSSSIILSLAANLYYSFIYSYLYLFFYSSLFSYSIYLAFSSYVCIF
jgi:hypothetical protein